MSAYARYVVLLLFLVNVANYGQRMMVAILSPVLQADLGLADWQLGVLMGGGFAIIFALAGVPLARFADRHGRARWLSVAVLAWSCATVAFGWSRSFVQLLLARAGLAAAQSAGIPVSHSLISDYVPTHSRPVALAVHSTGGVLGMTLASIIGGQLESHLGWRAAGSAIGLSSAALACLVYLTLREPPRTASALSRAGTRADFVALPGVVRHLLALRSYRWILVAISIATLVEFGLNQWLPSYYVRQFDLPVAEVGFRYGLAVALGGIPGSLIGGALAAALMHRDVRWLGWLPALSYAVAIPIGLTMLQVQDSGRALMLNALYAFAVFATNGPVWAASFAGVPPMMRTTASALTLLVSGVTGLSLGPTLVGTISDVVANHGGLHGLQSSLLAMEFLAIGVVISLLLAAVRLKRDSSEVIPVATGGSLRGTSKKPV